MRERRERERVRERIESPQASFVLWGGAVGSIEDFEKERTGLGRTLHRCDPD